MKRISTFLTDEQIAGLLSMTKANGDKRAVLIRRAVDAMLRREWNYRDMAKPRGKR